MGCTYSVPTMQMEHVALVSQVQAIAAFDPRVCDPQEVVTLNYKTHFIKNQLNFCDVATSASRLIVKGKSVMSVTFTLFGAYETPIVSYRFRNNYDLVNPVPLMFAGDSNCKSKGTDSELLQIHLKYELVGDKPVVRAEFHDISTKQHCEIGIVGRWSQHDACFWLDKGRSGVREPVAKVYWPQTGKARKYQFDVAPNMDPVLISIICRMLDGLHRAANSSSD